MFKITSGLLLPLLFLAMTQQTHTAVFRDALEYGNNASMIGVGKIEGYTPHPGVLFENTAAMIQADSGLSLFYLNAMDGSVNAMTGAISHHLSPNMSVGFGIAREYSDMLDFTGEENGEAVSLETFSYTNTAYIAGLGLNLTEMVSVGASYTHYDKQLYTVRGQGGAFGVSAHLDFKDTDLLLKAKNLGSNPIQYTQGNNESVFTEYGLTLGHRVAFSENLSATLMGQVKLSDGLQSLKSVGLRIYPFEKTLALGLGYQQSRGLGDQVYGGLTFGLDLSLSPMTFSYAYQTTQYVAKDHEHHFSVFFGF